MSSISGHSVQLSSTLWKVLMQSVVFCAIKNDILQFVFERCCLPPVNSISLGISSIFVNLLQSIKLLHQTIFEFLHATSWRQWYGIGEKIIRCPKVPMAAEQASLSYWAMVDSPLAFESCPVQDNVVLCWAIFEALMVAEEDHLFSSVLMPEFGLTLYQPCRRWTKSIRLQLATFSFHPNLLNHHSHSIFHIHHTHYYTPLIMHILSIDHSSCTTHHATLISTTDFSSKGKGSSGCVPKPPTTETKNLSPACFQNPPMN